MIGIYVITNTVTGEQYVGMSQNVAYRFWQHREMLRKGQHHNSLLQVAWNRDGEAAFLFEGLEEMPPSTEQDWHLRNQEELRWLRYAEWQWQKKLNPAYKGIVGRHPSVYVEEDIPMRAT